MSDNYAKMHKPKNLSATIIRAVSKDAEAIMTLKRDAWLGAYVNEAYGITDEDIRNKFTDETLVSGIENWRRGLAGDDGKTRVTYVARVDDKVVGFVAPRIENGQRRVGALYVLPAMQGRGVGGKLLSRALKWYGNDEDVYLHVVSYNDKAIGFYEHFGFEKTDKKLSDEVGSPGGKSIPEIEMVLKANLD